MPGKFKHEEVSAVPRGYRTRTVRRGSHEIRVAFPRGRRRRGAGRVVSILHPVGENPNCPIRQIADRIANPEPCKCGSGEPAVFGGMCARCAREKAREARERAGQIRGARLNPAKAGEWIVPLESGTVLRFPSKAEAKKAVKRQFWSQIRRERKANPDSHRISWSDEMVSRLVAAYQGWRRAGMGHREALDRTLADTTAGKGAIAEFKRRISRSGFGNNPSAEYLARELKQAEAEYAKARQIYDTAKKGSARWRQAAADLQFWGNKKADLSRGRNPRELSVAEQHQLKIARDTLRMPDAMAGVMGGPTKKQAREIIRRLTKKNPDELAGAEDLYREFHGREPHEILEMQESELARRDYTALGPLVELHTELPNGSKAKISFGDADAVLVVSSPNGRQLYLLGGNQDISGSLAGMGVDSSKELIDLGDAVFLSYDASKWQTDFKPTIWEHKLGEESGIRPRAFYDQLKRRIFFAGGNYRVERPGIID